MKTIERSATWARKLAEKRVLPLSPDAFVAIKRDVRTVEIGAAAADYAEAFHLTMRDPGQQFGLIQVLRPNDRVGKAYELGERFQGRYNLPSALMRRTMRPLQSVLKVGAIEMVLHRLGDAVASDFGMIDLLELDGPDRYAFRYRYLEGSPIAGSSTFIVEPTGDATCRLTQIFEYQEIKVDVAAFFSTYGLKLHNQVVASQAQQSAKRLGAEVIASDIPDAYLDI